MSGQYCQLETFMWEMSWNSHIAQCWACPAVGRGLTVQGCTCSVVCTTPGPPGEPIIHHRHPWGAHQSPGPVSVWKKKETLIQEPGPRDCDWLWEQCILTRCKAPRHSLLEQPRRQGEGYLGPVECLEQPFSWLEALTVCPAQEHEQVTERPEFSIKETAKAWEVFLFQQS